MTERELSVHIENIKELVKTDPDALHDYLVNDMGLDEFLEDVNDDIEYEE